MTLDENVQKTTRTDDSDSVRLCAYVMRDTNMYGEEGLFIHLDRATPEGRKEAERKYHDLERALYEKDDGEEEYVLEQIQLEDLPVVRPKSVGNGLRAYVFEHDTIDFQHHAVVFEKSLADAARTYHGQHASMELITSIEELPITEGEVIVFRAEYGD